MNFQKSNRQARRISAEKSNRSIRFFAAQTGQYTFPQKQESTTGERREENAWIHRVVLLEVLGVRVVGTEREERRLSGFVETAIPIQLVAPRPFRSTRPALEQGTRIVNSQSSDDCTIIAGDAEMRIMADEFGTICEYARMRSSQLGGKLVWITDELGEREA